MAGISTGRAAAASIPGLRAALALRHVTAEEFDRWVKPAEMARGGDGR
jgi:hypothetical protein